MPNSFWEVNVELKKNFEESFKLQTQYLYDHLEWDLRGNHLIRDALGLINGAQLIEGSAQTLFKEKAVSIVLDQIEEQILEDGSHFELSAMYHVEFMQDLIKIFQISDHSELQNKIKFCVQKMWQYIRWCEHLDGKLVQFNDGCLISLERIRGQILNAGIEIKEEELRGAKFFSSSGLMAWRSKHCVFFLDAK